MNYTELFELNTAALTGAVMDIRIAWMVVEAEEEFHPVVVNAAWDTIEEDGAIAAAVDREWKDEHRAFDMDS